MIEKNPKIPESMVVLTSEPKDIKFTIRLVTCAFIKIAINFLSVYCSAITD